MYGIVCVGGCHWVARMIVLESGYAYIHAGAAHIHRIHCIDYIKVAQRVRIITNSNRRRGARRPAGSSVRRGSSRWRLPQTVAPGSGPGWHRQAATLSASRRRRSRRSTPGCRSSSGCSGTPSASRPTTRRLFVQYGYSSYTTWTSCTIM